MSKKSKYRYTKPNGKNRSINKLETIVDAVGDQLILETENFSSIFAKAKELIHSEYNASDDALKNARGTWFEQIVTFGAIEYQNLYDPPGRMLSLPNANSYDVGKLYSEEYYEYITDLREKVGKSANVNLITSNPDFVIIDKDIEISLPDIIGTKKTVEDVKAIEQCYLQAEHKCSFDQIKGYLGLKTSLRPDRRLQLAHEGSLMKALYKHIQTRDWVLDAPGIKYFGMSTEVKPKDIDALRTVATHSIVTVSNKPESAVDDVFSVSSGEELKTALDSIFQQIN